MKQFWIGLVVGALVMYVFIEYIMFKHSQRFHDGVRVKLTWRKYFLGRD